MQQNNDGRKILSDFGKKVERIHRNDVLYRSMDEKKFSESAGVSDTLLYSIRSGKNSTSLRSLLAITNNLGLTLLVSFCKKGDDPMEFRIKEETDIADMMISLRNNYGLSRRRFVERTGLSCIYKYEKKPPKAFPSVDRLAKMANNLGLKLCIDFV